MPVWIKKGCPGFLTPQVGRPAAVTGVDGGEGWGGGGGGGGSRCRVSIIRKGNVTLSNLRNSPVACR